MADYETISFLSDFGTADESVGVVKSVIRTIAPRARVIDITHEIPPFDVRTGSVVLARSANYLAPGIVLAIVDPGVGTDRKAIAVELGDGESVLLGPDNGILAPTAALVGGATRVVELTNSEYQLDASGLTSAARDVFGPAAAHLCNGVDLAELGTIIEADSLVPATMPFSEEKDGVINCDVIYVDRYGNLHLNLAPEQLSTLAVAVRVNLVGIDVVVQRVSAYGSVKPLEPLLMIDEVGLMSLALNQASAAEHFGAAIGTTVTVGPPD